MGSAVKGLNTEMLVIHIKSTQSIKLLRTVWLQIIVNRCTQRLVILRAEDIITNSERRPKNWVSLTYFTGQNPDLKVGVNRHFQAS